MRIPNTRGPITIPSAISSTIDGNRILGKSPSASGAASAAAATTATPPNETFVSWDSVLVGVALGHLTFVCSEGSQYLTLLPLRHVEVVERSRKLSRDFVEDLGRDLQRPMGLFQAEVSRARFRGCPARVRVT